jgi:serine/threonine protein kinase
MKKGENKEKKEEEEKDKAKVYQSQEILVHGKFKLLNFHKAGGFGEIFFAKHKERGFDVAIKFVSIYFCLNNCITVRVTPSKMSLNDS